MIRGPVFLRARRGTIGRRSEAEPARAGKKGHAMTRKNALLKHPAAALAIAIMAPVIGGCAGPAPSEEATAAPERMVAAAPPTAAGGELLAGEIPFLDGDRAVRAVRVLGPATGAALAPIVLRYGPGRPEIPAFVGKAAVASIDAGSASDADVTAAFAELGVRAIRPLMRSAGLWLVEDQGDGDGLDVASRLSARAGAALNESGSARLRHAVPDIYLRRRVLGDPFSPDDPSYPGQWFFKNLNMPEAWSYSKGDPSVTVVVIDSGCDMTHPDLASKMDPGKDVIDGDDDPTPAAGESDNAHGTACAGIIGAATNNSEGIASGCPECRLRCVRGIGDVAIPISSDVDAFNFALETNASVVSNSWGFADPIPVPKAIETAINNVFDTGRGGKGALVVFAAGNEAREVADDEILAVRGVLGIGAINNLDEETPFTNSGNSVDLVAPTGTLTTDISGPQGYDPGNYVNSFGGTSSACPVAASIGALLVSAAPDKTSQEIYDVLIKTARPAPYAVPDENGHDLVFGYGIIDPVKALRDVLGIVEEPDAGPPPADAGVVTPPDDDTDDGCGCSAPGRSTSSLSTQGALLIAASAALYRAGRRARRRRTRA